MNRRHWLRKIQVPVIWAIAVLFGAGVIWWSVATYMSGRKINTSSTTDLNIENTIAYLTKNGTPLEDERYWITYSEFTGTVRDSLDGLKKQGIVLDPYFGDAQRPSEMDYRYGILLSLVDQKVLSYYAFNKGIYPTKEELDAETNKIVDQYTSSEEYKLQIEQLYGSVEAFRQLVAKYVTNELLQTKVMNDIFPNLDNDIKEYFAENKDEIKNKYEKVEASHILVDSEASATEIKNLIESGDVSFSEAASEFSIDAQSAMLGGSLGSFGHGQMVPEFEEAVFSATPGVIVGPVKTEYGYHLIEVATKTTFDTYDELVKSPVYEQVKKDYQNQEFNTWLKEYKEKEGIGYVINEPDLKLYEEYKKSESEEAKAAFLEKLENSLFDSEGNIVIVNSFLAPALYVQLTDEKLDNLDSEIFKLKSMIELYENLPATVTSLTTEEIENKVAELEDSTDTELKTLYSNAKRLKDYEAETGLTGKEDVNTKLAELKAEKEELDAKFARVVKFLYENIPYSSKVIEYAYKVDNANPEVVYRYNELKYNQNLKPLLKDPATLENYVNYYKQYFGDNARSFLIDYPLQSIEQELNQKVIKPTDVATELKVNALFLLVDAYEKLANISSGTPLYQIYLLGEKRYLEELNELMPGDTNIGNRIEAIDTLLKAPLESPTPEATE
ncbi:peptidylprolyl isomerase, partial [Kosmotoga pacifica]|uniref:peptidylprolyl isomerase n=1 Tax=Kosmotoga pacifica TaxID=1330330 RepID=UPI0006499DA7